MAKVKEFLFAQFLEGILSCSGQDSWLQFSKRFYNAAFLLAPHALSITVNYLHFKEVDTK
jgi:hypothetical protein